MTFVLLAALAIAAWAWRKGAWRALRQGDVAAAVAALMAAGLLSHGRMMPALLGLAGAGWWYWLRTHPPRRRRGAAAPDVAEACDLLEVPDDADGDTIRAAHRRLIQRVHPDAGGTAELARRVNQARDILLARIGDGRAGPDSPRGVPRRS